MGYYFVVSIRYLKPFISQYAKNCPHELLSVTHIDWHDVSKLCQEFQEVDAVVKATVSGGMCVYCLDRDVKICSMAIQASISADVVRYSSLLEVIFSFAHSSKSSSAVTVC